MPFFSQKPFQKNTAAVLIIAILSTLVFNFLLWPAKEARAIIEVNDAAAVNYLGLLLAEQSGYTGASLTKFAEQIGVSKETVDMLVKANEVATESKNLLSGILEDVTLNKAANAAAWILLKELLARITDEINAWIMDGKKPQFVGDWKEFLQNAANQAGGKFVDEHLGQGWLCESFDMQIKIALATPPEFSEAAKCTISDIVENVEDFFENFENGGWEAWIRISEPQNNFYGAYLMARGEKYSREEAAALAAQNEALAGHGWLGTKDADGKIKTPGSVISAQINKQIDSGRQMLQDQIVALTPHMGVMGDILLPYLQSIANTAVNKMVKMGLGAIGVSSP